MTPREIIDAPRSAALGDFSEEDLVVYVPQISQRMGSIEELEMGVVSSINEEFVFVRFSAKAVAGMACCPLDLVNLTKLFV